MGENYTPTPAQAEWAKADEGRAKWNMITLLNALMIFAGAIFFAGTTYLSLCRASWYQKDLDKAFTKIVKDTSS